MRSNAAMFHSLHATYVTIRLVISQMWDSLPNSQSIPATSWISGTYHCRCAENAHSVLSAMLQLVGSLQIAGISVTVSYSYNPAVFQVE